MIDGITLALDGSTYSGSVAVIRDDVLIAERELPASPTPGRTGRDENFMPMVAAALTDAGIDSSEIDRVVCGEGPGSFTSLRIAASIAKGIAVGTGCPLFSVSSLLLIVADRSEGRYVATLAAMRGEHFALLAEVTAPGRIDAGDPVIVPESAIEAYASDRHARHIDERPHARAVRTILPSIIASGERDIDSWEPTYGRLAEAQVKWEAAHGRALPTPG
jgi:tRNA threonylcarbamoyladenosine biosynthesis protein TsaB